VNFVGNYYKPGAAWDHTTRYALKAEYESFPGTQRYYFQGNHMAGVFDESNQTAGRIFTGSPNGYSPWVNEPFFPSEGIIHPVRLAYKYVLSDVGATQPVFDDHDRRIIRETRNGSYAFRGSRTNLPGLPDSEQDVGGWEDYPAMVRHMNWDSDHDGMPDWWEKVMGLNPASVPGDFSESNADPDRNGYTNLEEFLNWMAEPHYIIDPDSTLKIPVSSLFMGFTNNPNYSITYNSNGEADLLNDSIAQYIPDGEGLGSLTLKVVDAGGDSLIRRIGIYSGPVAPDSLLEAATSDQIPRKPATAFGNSINCFPNPAGEELFIRGDFSRIGRAELRISNLTGRIVHTQQLYSAPPEGDLRIDLSNICPIKGRVYI
jgi:hypothetical protein